MSKLPLKSLIFIRSNVQNKAKKNGIVQKRPVQDEDCRMKPNEKSQKIERKERLRKP